MDKMWSLTRRIRECLKTIKDTEDEIENLVYMLEQEMVRQEIKSEKANNYAKAFDKRTPEVQRFLDSIDRMFGINGKEN